MIDTLLLLVRGMGVNNACRQAGVTINSVLAWTEKAGGHSVGFTEYMQKNMQMDQVQIDEFWSYVRKKRKTLQIMRNACPD